MKSFKELIQSLKTGKGSAERYDELDSQLKDQWNDPAPSMTDAEIQDTKDVIFGHVRRNRRQIYLWPMAVAASLVIAAVTTVWVLKPAVPEKRSFADGKVYAGRDYIRLEDGTTVLLNSGAEMTVEYSDSARVITLKGEGHFKVTRNVRLPFYVKNSISHLMVKVLGTEFTINYGPKHHTVFVDEGRVQVTNDELDYGVLSADEALEVNLQTALVSKLKGPEKSPDWTDHFFVLEDIPMDSAVSLMEDRFKTKIRFKNPAVGKCIVNARFMRNEDLTFILDMLSGALGITYEVDKENNILTIDGRGCN